MQQPPLKEYKRKDFPEYGEIEDSLMGVNFDYNFSGQRQGKDGYIELYITIRVRDYKGQTFTRKSVFYGNKKNWKEVVEKAIVEYMKDLNCGIALIRAIMQDFEFDSKRYIPLERYHQ